MLTIGSPDCFDANSGFVMVDATGGTPPYQFALDNSGFQDDNTFQGLTAGAYQVLLQDANGCSADASFAINAPIPVTVGLGNDMTIELGDGTTISAITNLPDSLLETIDWTGLGENAECPTCPSQYVAPILTTTYSITVESVDGCEDSDALTLFVDRERRVYVPSAFSPNGDGQNDFFYVFAKENSIKQINSFLIFDRWGESMFEAFDFQPNDPSRGWDGSHRGQPMNPAVFVWFAEIEFVDGNTEVLEGDIVLLR
jgi:gliding motility-associated-like protein